MSTGRDSILLAGDVGGTKANLALFRHREGAPLEMVRSKRFPSADFPGLNEIVAAFVKVGGEKVDGACFGVPGPVLNNRAHPTNLKWEIDGASIGQDLGTHCVYLLNDLAANAVGIAELEEKDFVTLQAGRGGATGNRCIVSPGTGLGEAGLHWDGQRYRVWATEGGHTDFAPRTAIEMDLLTYLQERFGHVSVERVVSGQGIANIYGFLRDSGHGTESPEVAEAFRRDDAAKVITQSAEKGSCSLCSQTLEIFAHCLANEAANFALKAMATGGVYLGGGIPAKVLWKLKSDTFVGEFNAKGRLEPLMESMPLRIVLNDNAALLGAARYAMDSLECL